MGLKLNDKIGAGATPSPGHYTPKQYLTKSRVVGSALDKAQRTEPMRPQSATVGPGYYELRGKVPGPYYGY